LASVLTILDTERGSVNSFSASLPSSLAITAISIAIGTGVLLLALRWIAKIRVSIAAALCTSTIAWVIVSVIVANAFAMLWPRNVGLVALLTLASALVLLAALFQFAARRSGQRLPIARAYVVSLAFLVGTVLVTSPIVAHLFESTAQR
jgi:hypothetical protein